MGLGKASTMRLTPVHDAHLSFCPGRVRVFFFLRHSIQKCSFCVKEKEKKKMTLWNAPVGGTARPKMPLG